MTGQHGLALAMNLTRHVQVSKQIDHICCVFSAPYNYLIQKGDFRTYGILVILLCLSFTLPDWTQASLRQHKPGARTVAAFPSPGISCRKQEWWGLLLLGAQCRERSRSAAPILKPQHTLRGHLVQSLFCSATPVLPWNHRWVTQLRMLCQFFRTPNLIRDQQS